MQKKIKDFFKRFLPPPINVFNREVEHILSCIEINSQVCNREISALQLELTMIKEQTLSLLSIETRLTEIVMHNHSVDEQVRSLFSATIDDIQMQNEKSIELKAQLDELLQKIELHSKDTEIKDLLLKLSTEGGMHASIIREVLWAEIFNNTVSNSSWLKDCSFSPGRWAVGYPLLYVLYRSIEQTKPRSILELGLGQSTKMIAQYTDLNPEVKHLIIEQNPKWINFFKKTEHLPNNSVIKNLNCMMESYSDKDNIRVYEDFVETVSNRNYDLILIDAPSAEGMDQYSRIDILKIIPRQLADHFVLILDDCNRIAEINTALEITRILNESSISFMESRYIGEKTFRIWVSSDYAFLCSL